MLTAEMCDGSNDFVPEKIYLLSITNTLYSIMSVPDSFLFGLLAFGKPKKKIVNLKFLNLA